MTLVLASNVFSGGQILWLLFLYIGLPALLLIGIVTLLIVAVRNSNKK
jgi:hypothetical protein